MKKTNAKKKLLPAIGMLAISAAMLSSATFAWFTMNKTVQVTGMTMQTKVSGNLLICSTNNEEDYAPDTLTQTRSALLEPVSSIKGTTGSFFYTVDALANGNKAHAASTNNYVPYSESTALAENQADTYNASTLVSTGAAKTHYDATFNGATAYNISGAAADAAVNTNAYGYVDYTFYLKATCDAASQTINMTRCQLLKDNAALGATNDAWRIAVFADDITTGRTDGQVAADPAASTKSPITVLTPEGAQYFQGDNKAVSAANAAPSTAVTNIGQAAIIDTFGNTVGETRYYKVVVRVWLEGEDTSCFSENYSTVESSYSLDLAFELGKGTAVDGIDTAPDSWAADANPAV